MLQYFLLLSLLASNIRAQDTERNVEVSIFAGAAFAELWESPRPDFGDRPGVLPTYYHRYEQLPLTNSMFGVSLSYWFYKPLGLELGARCIIQGGRTEYEYGFSPTTNEFNGYTTSAITMLSLPMGVVGRVLQTPVTIDVGAGLDYAVALSRKGHRYSKYTSSDEVLESNNEFGEVGEDDLGLRAKISVGYSISSRIGLQITGGYTYGLTEHVLYDHSEFYPNEESMRVYWTSRSLQVTAGALFTL